MRVAHILPPEVLIHVKDYLDEYHMLLPSLLPKYGYREFYRTAAGVKIMDNGVAEQDAVSFVHQLYMAKALGCNEVILPDVMGSMDKTLNAIAIVYYQAFTERARYKYMLVAQGSTVLECISTVERALNMFPGIVQSVGIPRHILSQGDDARVRIGQAVRDITPNRPIHLLGTHPEHVGELFNFKRPFMRLGIRGVDTSLAWNATLAGATLNDPDSLSYNISIDRQPIKEFAKAKIEDHLQLLQHNIGRINWWAKS